MIKEKHIVVIPCICSDALYTEEHNGTTTPQYFNTEREALKEIAEFEREVGYSESHYPVQVIVNQKEGTITDKRGYDWSTNLYSQAPEAQVI